MRTHREPAGPGQESVWDYPRPPILQPSSRHVLVKVCGCAIADSRRAMRLLETSHPPTWYIPFDDCEAQWLLPVGGTSFCEFKGQARFFDVVVVQEDRRRRAAWTYPTPTPRYQALAGYISFYASKTDACFVDGERVIPQPGDFYGGWITSELVGPFKGGPGTRCW